MLKTTDITEPEIEKLSLLGVPFWVDRDRGRLIPVVRGGAEGDPPADPPADPPTDPPADPPADKTFTQAEVDRMMGRTRSEATKAARTEIESFLASEKAKTDEATLGEAARADAARERFEAKVERKLGAAGVSDTAIARATRLVNLDPDASDDDIAAEIETLKTEVPGLFTSSTEDDESGKGKGAPSGVTTSSGSGKGKGTGSKTAMERGRDLYAEKHKKSTTAA
jgi:hypothetical protein